jgi:hypothetical protein
VEKNPGNEFGITWGGQGEPVARLLQGVVLELVKSHHGSLGRAE